MKILISAPIHNREWILDDYLRHLLNIDYKKKDISMYFIVNNCTDRSEMILNNFKRKYSSKYDSIVVEKIRTNYKFEDSRTSGVRLKYSYHHLSELRNRILDYASDNDFDYLLSCDSDILVPPDILLKLLSHNKNCCSSLIYNGYIANPQKPYLFPNILKYDGYGYFHISNWYVKNSPRLKKSRLLQVDVTGAVVLISKNIFKNKKIRYGFHRQGEDIYWSEAVRREGYRLYCDLGCFSHHIMSRKMLNEQKGVLYS